MLLILLVLPVLLGLGYAFPNFVRNARCSERRWAKLQGLQTHRVVALSSTSTAISHTVVLLVFPVSRQNYRVVVLSSTSTARSSTVLLSITSTANTALALDLKKTMHLGKSSGQTVTVKKPCSTKRTAAADEAHHWIAHLLK